MGDGWLPSPFDETICEIEERYAYFRRDYVERPPDVFAPKRFEVDSRLREGREEAFYHLTTSGSPERKHDPYRCGRIHWGRPIIQEVDDPGRVTTWRARKNGENRIKIALRDFEYLVVLAEDGASIRLVTAFYVRYAKEREKLRLECGRTAERA